MNIKPRRSVCAFIILVCLLSLLASCSLVQISPVQTDSGETLHLITDEPVQSPSPSPSPAAKPETSGQPAGKTPDGKDETPVIDKNGTYTSKEDVALYIHTYG